MWQNLDTSSQSSEAPPEAASLPEKPQLLLQERRREAFPVISNAEVLGHVCVSPFYFLDHFSASWAIHIICSFSSPRRTDREGFLGADFDLFPR